jgi:predicted peroxiredoxin
MAGLLIVGATGPGDATRASIPLHIAANGAVPGGVAVAVAFAGDAAALLKPDVIDSVRGVGIPPLRELFDKCVAQNVPFYV